MQKIVISIVTYNSKYVFEVLDNLIDHFADASNVRIKIFDNNSTAEYKERLKNYSEDAEITFHNENLGFGSAHNLNLKNLDEPLFLILNPDAIINKDGLDKLVETISLEDDTGLVVPQILNPDGTIQYLIRERVSVFDYALRYLRSGVIKKMFDNRLAKYECRELPDDEIVPVRIGSGCCMLIKKDVFNAISGFDERYFMYFEDYDLCLELEKNGYKVLYNPFVKFIHYYGKEAHKNQKLFKIFITSMIKFFNKWGWKLF